MTLARSRAAVVGACAICLVSVSCDMLLGLAGEDELDCATIEASAPGWLVRSCVMRVSCTPFVEEFKIGQCIGKTVPFASPYDRCTSKANSCFDMHACSGIGLATQAQCAGKAKGWHCQGERGVRCGFGDPYFVDCAFHGAQCKLYGNAETGSAWPCTIEAKDSCSPDGVGYCEGSMAVFCSNGRRWGYDCAKRQLRCAESEGQSYCSRYTEPCASKNKAGCVDGRYSVCTTSGYGVNYDCNTAGGTCKYGSCGPAACKQIPFESKCFEKCLDDSRMQVCVFWDTLAAGQPLVVDCKEHGFERCEMRDDPKSSRDFAVCR